VAPAGTGIRAHGGCREVERPSGKSTGYGRQFERASVSPERERDPGGESQRRERADEGEGEGPPLHVTARQLEELLAS
jgi:hypothetical protein